MTGVALRIITEHLDALLDTEVTPDYSGAVNGLQVDSQRPVTRIAVAVDASLSAIDGAVATGAELLIVHHGLFWSGVSALRGPVYERFRRLLVNDIAVYSSHLPLDRHQTLGNNVLLAREIGLEPTLPFARFQSIFVGVAGECDIATSEIADRLESFANREGGRITTIGITHERRTHRWALCTGAGASSDSLREAQRLGVDTLIVGEGPHHTGVEAQDLGIAVIYAGHYATETLGVRALGAELERSFGIPWSFIAAPTGL
jgi:dinuclear metal center YbgI/SA1388 family protein